MIQIIDNTTILAILILGMLIVLWLLVWIRFLISFSKRNIKTSENEISDVLKIKSMKNILEYIEIAENKLREELKKEDIILPEILKNKKTDNNYYIDLFNYYYTLDLSQFQKKDVIYDFNKTTQSMLLKEVDFLIKKMV